MFDKLKSVEKRYNDLNQFLSDPKIISQQSEFQKYAREQSELSPIVLRFQDWQKITRELEENKKILEEEQDQDLADMAQEEIADLETQKEKAVADLKFLLLPKDPRDDRNVIVEIRAG
ncbi:MAG: PCRF domain-containing protein, partial [Nitrospina sp.]|nr:PCRF domain-containing protein [Nitrospina sp.]